MRTAVSLTLYGSASIHPRSQTTHVRQQMTDHRAAWGSISGLLISEVLGLTDHATQRSGYFSGLYRISTESQPASHGIGTRNKIATANTGDDRLAVDEFETSAGNFIRTICSPRIRRSLDNAGRRLKRHLVQPLPHLSQSIYREQHRQ